MKLVQLLTGVGVAALLAGTASAQEATLDATGDLNGQTIVPEITTNQNGDLVLDFEFVSAGPDAVFGTADDVPAFGTLGAGGGVVLRIDLTNATLDGVFSGALDPTEAACQFGAPTLGGGSGGDFIQYASAGGALQGCDPAAAADANDGTLTIPVNITDENQPVRVVVSYTGDGVDDNTFQDSSDPLEAVVIGDASLDFTIAAGAAGAGLFSEDGSALLAGASGVIATLAIADLPDNEIAVAAAAAELDDVSDLVASAELVVTFPSGATGIGSVTYDSAGANVTCNAGVAPSDNVYTCSLSAANLDLLVDAAGDFLGAPREIEIDDDSDANTSITPQIPTVALNLTGQTGFDVSGANEAATNVRKIELDDGVVTQGINTATPFEWTSLRTAGGTKSAFRITGLEANPSEIAVVVAATYARAGATAPTAARAVITGADVQEDPLNAGEYIATFTSEDLAAALGTDGGINGDVSFEVVLPDLTGVANLEARRLLSNSGNVAGTGFDQ